jgi:hypothetical protein
MNQLDTTRLTRRQAEIVAGVSRATLARYVADGKLSAAKNADGHNVYDAAELHRVFPESFDLRRLETPASRDGVSPDETRADTLRDTPSEAMALAELTVEIRYLKEERNRLREDNERLRREVTDEREKRDEERSELLGMLRQNQETVKLLTDQRILSQPTEEPALPPAPPRFLGWLFGRR